MNCKICGSETNEHIVLGNNLIYFCNKCDYYFCAEPNGTSEYTYNVYDDYEYLLKPLRDTNYDIILKNINGLLPQNATGLEVGSALGWF